MTGNRLWSFVKKAKESIKILNTVLVVKYYQVILILIIKLKLNILEKNAEKLIS